jgi:hypothetical protein
LVIPRSPFFCHSEKHPFLVIPRSAATRNLLEFCTASRRFPNCRFLTAFGMTTGKGASRGPHLSFRGAPLFGHSEKPLFLSFREAPLFGHSEERSDEESPRTLHRLPPFSQLQIPHYVRNDSGKRGIPRATPVIPRSAPFFCHSEEPLFLSFRGAQRRGISSNFAPPPAVFPTADSSLRSE